jgi:heavy metal sensor kinase
MVFSSFLFLTIRTQQYADVDRELLAIAEAVASPTLEPFRSSPPTVLDQVLEDFIGSKIADKYVQLSDSKGNLVSRSRNLQQFNLSLDPVSLRAAAKGTTIHRTIYPPSQYPVRTVAVPVLNGSSLDQLVHVGVPLIEVTEVLDRLLLFFAISIPAAILILGSGGWFLAGRALKPVDLITRSAQKISAENLGLRLEVVNPNDEIGRLANTFNMTLERLEQSFIRIRQFSTDVSHELRTPLTIMQGETEMGLRAGKDPDDFRQILQSNLEEINRMSGIISYLIDLARVESKGLGINKELVDLKELLQELVVTKTLQAHEKNIMLSYSGDKAVIVEGDLHRLMQIFGNLVDNALNFTAPGGEVKVALDHDQEMALVSVRDSGPGIAAADVPFIFDRFYQVDKARNRSDGGIGLGLSLVESLTAAHGGRIAVDSEVGRGSTFIVSLPLKSATGS